MAEVCGEPFAPLRIELRRPVPVDGGRTHGAHFGCPVVFGTAGIAIVLPADRLDLPLAGANAELADYADALALRYLQQVDRRDVASRARLIILRELATGGVSKASVAQELHMSQSTLQQKLAARGTSFNALLEEVRRALAARYLADRSRSVTEIAYLLGFAGSSSFCRAYKRWTGRAPGDERGATP
jgi:AraC-like DNA-binding protein